MRTLADRIADELEFRARTAAALARGGHSVQAEIDRGKARVRELLGAPAADGDTKGDFPCCQADSGADDFRALEEWRRNGS